MRAFYPFLIYFSVIHIFLLPKYKKTLTKKIQTCKDAHACQHSRVFPQLHRTVRHDRHDQRLCSSVGRQIADCDVDCEPYSAFQHLSAVPERYLPVQKIAQDADRRIIHRRRHPVRAPEYIIEPEHHRHSGKSVHDPCTGKPECLSIYRLIHLSLFPHTPVSCPSHVRHTKT